MDTTTQNSNLDLPKVLEEIFMVLTGKEKEVMTKRFGLDSKPRQTLEKIGQKFSVTRERIRQIEKIALTKLKRTSTNTHLIVVNEIATELVKAAGGVMLESTLITEVLSRIASTHDVDAQITKLALSINQYLSITERNNFIHTFWRQNSIEEKAVFEIAEEGVKVLTKKNSVMSEEELANQIKLNLGEKAKSYQNGLIINSLTVDKRFKKVKDGFGLMTWRQINPKSIRDKAYIILKKAEKPMHFAEIATEITKTHFDNKHVTVQAVHNELIRYDQFVLVGRGLYALKEWGYRKGTVADVIEGLLRKKSPMSKQEIIVAVLKERHVKKGTISLNLQKNDKFVRVGRAVYSLNEK
ncbi:MAG: sigma factor-like helix-turn-helix DNA-binding protein [Candidatus Gracilibacteria bacterium]|jgi:DNA-binding PadR family transcriptional regulator